MNSTFSVHFHLKKVKSNSSHALPIYIRVTCNGERTEISTGRVCDWSQWNNHKGRTNGRTYDLKSINSFLDTLQHKLFDCYHQLVELEIPVNVAIIKDRFYGKENNSIGILTIFSEHNEKVKALVGLEFALGTLQRYEISLRHTRDFIKWKYSLDEIDVRKIDHQFITEYDFYLRSVRKCANNSAVKYIKNFGKIIRICMANSWIDRNPFANYKSKVREVERVYLTEDEIQVMATKEFNSVRLEWVRDVFLFCCFTGLAYIDVYRLRAEDIRIGIDGGKWIYINRKKTDTKSTIPLLSHAERILNKYKDDPSCINYGRLLPVSSNQKLNCYLKELASICGITKELTFHVARHTFATTVTLTNGVPIESVSRMLGHKNLKITQHYAKVLDNKLSEDMNALKLRLQKSKLSLF